MSESQSQCPYRSMMNKFSFFNKAPANALTTEDTERGLIDTPVSSCPFKGQAKENTKLEPASVAQEKKIKNDVKDEDSDEEVQPQGGCPVMNKSKFSFKISQKGPWEQTLWKILRDP